MWTSVRSSNIYTAAGQWRQSVAASVPGQDTPAPRRPPGQRTEAGRRIRIIINIDTLPTLYTATQHTRGIGALLRGHVLQQTHTLHSVMLLHPMDVDIHL